MEKDLLQAVINVEAEIQRSIESEKQKAAAWLESVRASLSRELESKKQELEEEYARSLATTCNQCELQAKKEIVDADRMAENLQNLPDDMLRVAVKEFLHEIIPQNKTVTAK